MYKRQIPKALFEPLNEVEASDLIVNQPLIDLLKKEVPLAIEEAHKNKKTFATLFEVNGLGYYIDIPKQYWVVALEQCINYKLEEEKFEECIPLKKLIDELKKPIKTVPKKNQKK